MNLTNEETKILVEHDELSRKVDSVSFEDDWDDEYHKEWETFLDFEEKHKETMEKIWRAQAKGEDIVSDEGTILRIGQR
jgi:hypothetical protein